MQGPNFEHFENKVVTVKMSLNFRLVTAVHV